MEEGNKTAMCSCPYCGQVHLLEVESPDDPQACETAVIMACDCAGAKKWQQGKKMIEAAKRKIAETFGPQEGQEKGPVSAEAIELMQRLVPEICAEHILEAKIKLTPNITAKIGQARNGNLVVERKITTTAKEEVSPYSN